ncbi:MAG: hypothetical protein HOV81_13485, partial [Kofleriaceae bacterium]|nr:hypothetical protein [Kofleriaceae bacterium]
EKSGSEKTGSTKQTKTGTSTVKASTKTGTGSKTKSGSGTKTEKPKCQKPGPNVDPFSSIPICAN